jgi:hypothetical protein
MFLYTKEQVLSKELCKAFIDNFELSDEKKPGVLYGPDGLSSDNGKKSTDLTFNPSYLQSSIWGGLLHPLVDILGVEKDNYVNRHLHAFTKLDPFELSTSFNLQKFYQRRIQESDRKN